ncbi:MAG: TonB family protein [Acidobacteriota bacterium]
MKIFLTLLVAVICSSGLVAAQDVGNISRVGVTVRDRDSLVLPAFSFNVAKTGEKDFSAITDINGRFEIAVSPGEYQITSSQLPAIKVFLKISELGPNPQNLDLIADSSGVCAGMRPAILKSVVPPFPPAARAVRALGQVTVTVSIGQDGKVLSAKAISGHPLLRRAAEVAAKQFLFEPSPENAERTQTLSFMFFEPGAERKEIPRFSCPYRILVVPDAQILVNTYG